MLGFKVERFTGLGPKDFAAFEEQKWCSNRFNLERMATRAKMEALGKAVFEALELGSMGLLMRTTLDHPHVLNRNRVSHCWTYFDRPDEERRELQRVIDRELTTKEKVDDPVPENHVLVLGIGVDAVQAQVFLRLNSAAVLDRKNWLARLADPADGSQFCLMLAKLPAELGCLVDGKPVARPVDVDSLTAFRKALESMTACFEFSVTLDKSSPEVTSEALVSTALGVLRPLLPIWQYAAWSKTNDKLKLKPVLKEEKKTLVKRLAGFEVGDEVLVTSGLLSGKQGKVLAVDGKGRVRISVGRLAVEVDSKLLKKAK